MRKGENAVTFGYGRLLDDGEMWLWCEQKRE